MKLTVKSTKIEENIEDEKGNVIGKISFDPQDVNVYKKFLSLIELITEKQKVDRQIGDLGDISKENLKSIEDFEKYSVVFQKLDKKLDNYLSMMDEIKKTTDEIFGDVSSTFSNITASLEPYTELITWATPYFNQGRKEKVDKYLESTDDVL